MKVKMLVSMAGPDESWKPGDVREVGEAAAHEWHGAGIAVILPAGPAVVKGEPVVILENQDGQADTEKPTVDELRAELDALGVKYHHKAGAAKLAGLLADAKAKA